MPDRDKCVEPKIGARIGEYIADVHAELEEQELTFEETTMLELHLLHCPFCRQKLDELARYHLETMCILTGAFIDDPVLKRKRQAQVKKFFLTEDRSRGYDYAKPWFDVTPEERKKIKALWRKE